MMSAAETTAAAVHCYDSADARMLSFLTGDRSADDAALVRGYGEHDQHVAGKAGWRSGGS